MSKFYGYLYPELSHWFGVNAVQRLEKKIHPSFIARMESALLDGLEYEIRRDASEFVDDLLKDFL